MRIAFVTTGLGLGGAEKALVDLLRGLHRRGIPCEVFSLREPGPMSDSVLGAGATLKALDIDPGSISISALLRLRSFLRASRADIVQGWMYHGNLAASLAGAGLPSKIVWSIRSEPHQGNVRTAALTRAVKKLSALLAKTPSAIVYNSRRSAELHIRMHGYPRDSATVVANGVDTVQFRPIEGESFRLRSRLGLPSAALIIGMLARYHPVKGHDVFLEAARVLAGRMPDVHYVLAGSGCDNANPTLARCLNGSALDGRVHLLGHQTEIPKLASGFDVGTVTSLSESFPNALAEMMSCGIPCVTTDVGDAAEIVGESGRVAASRNPAAIAAAWAEVLGMPASARRTLGMAARARIASRYTPEAYTDRFVHLYERIADKTAAFATE